MSLTGRRSVRALLGVALSAALGFALYEIAESPSSQLFGRTIVSGPKDQRIVALTYDDGPNPPYTNGILAVLEREQVNATFFVVGRAVAAYPAVVRRAYRDGDAIGNHTWNHGHLVLYDSAGLQQTLQRTDAAIFAATGAHPRIMRPPYGGRDWLVLGEARRLGFTPVMWSVPLPRDWEYPSAATIAGRVLRYVGNGSIIDLHDGNRGILCARDAVSSHVCDRSSDVAATRMIVEALKRRGYRFVTIPELLRADAGAATRTRVHEGE